MNIVKISADFITLSSGLSQDSFAKTHLIDQLAKKSRLFHIENDSVNSKDYVFSGTRAENGLTLFEGPSIGGKLLSDILTVPANERTESDNFSLTSFSKAVDFLLAQEEKNESEPFGAVGSGGIIINADEKAKTADILFVNPALFELCAQNHKKNYSDLQGKYIYKGLDAHTSLLFTRAVVAYRALTSHFPFENEDTSKRQEDIFDSNFIPLSLWDKKINENLSETIQAAFALSVKNEVMAGKRSLADAGAEQKRQRTIKKAEKFDSAIFFEELLRLSRDEEAESKEEMEVAAKKRSDFTLKTRKKLAVKRFFRRNKNRILASFAAVIVVSWFVTGFIRQNAKLVTSKGLDSSQTTHAFYTQFHRLDVPNLQEIVSGKRMKDMLVKVSGFYVSAKQRLEVSPDNGILPPARWFFYKKSSKNWMFGITNLKIDGIDYPAEGIFYQRKDKPLPIGEEGGRILKKGDEISHTAEYDFIHQAEAKIYIERMRDLVTLRWNGKQWKVVKVEGKAKIDTIKAKDFIEEYYAQAGNGVRQATDSLREKYDWLPSEKDFSDAAEYLSKEYGSVEAAKYLGK